jgi:HAD superfamily hydrolase (TIGR01490 family)
VPLTNEAAFFDLDKTVIARASMAAFGGPFYKGGLVSKTTVLRALYSQLVYLYLGASEKKLDKIRRSVLELTKGWEQIKVRSIVEDTLIETVDPILYKEAVEEIDFHQSQGRSVWLISASPEEIVKPLGRYIGVDGVIASRAEVDQDGKYTGEMEFYAYGENKAVAIKELAETEDIDLSKSYAYSDSATDIPMLEAVGHPICVNPDRQLARHARLSGWEVRHFKETMPLAERRGIKDSGHRAVTGSLVAFVILLAVAVGWRIGRSRKLN